MRSVDEIIENAMREGAFENLPGKGKPLELDENPYIDSEWQLAYHLLKQNGFAPEFIEQRQTIELELAAARETLARSWAWRNKALDEGKPADWVEAECARAKERFARSVAKINEQIRSYNLRIPTPKLYRASVDLHSELAALENKLKHLHNET